MTVISPAAADDTGDPIETPRKPIAGSPTRSRARLLWRGSLLLPDGTPLPGLCFVSFIAPLFASSTPAGDTSTANDADEDAEAELGLGLALETIRHAPIRIAKVIDGREGEAASQPSQSRRPAAAPATIEWRSSGNIRMYIDPREQGTVAFFERHFLYPLAAAASSSSSSCRSQTTFLLSTSISPLRPVSADPFRSTSIEPAAPGGQELALWATWDPPAQGQAPCAKLVVGRRIVKRLRASSGAFTRPDDPAPRIRPLAPSSQGNLSSLFESDSQRAKTAPRGSFSLSVPGGKPSGRSSLSKSRSTPNLVGLTPVKEEPDGGESSHLDAAHQRKRKSAGNHTPGRRGEKRPAKLGQQNPTGRHADPRSGSPRIKRERSASVMSALSMGASECPSPPSAPRATSASSTVEASNRAAIKKLVHYQLLGRGIEKGSGDYLACYGAACNGAFVALRNSMSSSPIVTSQAARIVAAHLGLYLDPLPDSASASS